MLIKEYRIVLPCTVEEYHVAQLYMVAKASIEETGSGEGVEILKNEPYEHTTEDGAVEKGQYTEKVIHLSNRLPGWVKAVIPSLKNLAVVETAWNAYPHCRTCYSCNFFGPKFSMEVITIHKNDNGRTENIHNLRKDELKNRVVDVIDIAFDDFDKKEYKVEEDPRIFKSTKTGRGPLDSRDWKDTVTPVMTCYKLCKVEFKYWGVQGSVERFIHKTGLRSVLHKMHRKLFCWLDDWFGLTMDDIRRMEDETKANLDNSVWKCHDHSDMTCAPGAGEAEIIRRSRDLSGVDLGEPSEPDALILDPAATPKDSPYASGDDAAVVPKD